MYLADVVFPLNLQYLTYTVPDDLRSTLKEGQLIRAPLKGRERVGLLLRLYRAEDTRGNNKLKPLSGIFHTRAFYHPEMLKLLKWLSEYYLCNYGTAFKCMFFKELIKEPKRVSKKTLKPEGLALTINRPSSINRLRQTLSKSDRYCSILYKAVSEQEELLVAEEVLRTAERAIVMAPEIEDAELLYGYLYQRFREKVCLYHSGLSFTRRHESLKGYLAGRFRIMVGTRSVVFAPLRASLIMVTREHSLSYKKEDSPRLNARDVAVMRAYLEDIPVVLSSTTPCTETYLNCLKGKYRLIRSSLKRLPPSIQVIDIRKEKMLVPYLSRKVAEAMKKKQKQGVLGIIQRLGYSMIRCEECYEVLSCPLCSKPLMLHKQGFLLCHHCGGRQSPRDNCPNCGSHRLEFYGSGKERIIEVIERLTKETESLSTAELDEKTRSIVLGTLSKKGLRRSRFSLISFLNPDIMLNMPDIKGTERLIQEVFSLRELLNEKGLIQLQTTVPWHPVFRFLKRWDYEGFLKYLLSERKKLNLPPYVKTILIDVLSKRPKEVESFQQWVSKRHIPVLGPLSELRRKREHSLIKIIIMKETITTSRAIAKEIIQEAEKRGLSYRVDVEPVGLGE